MLPVTVQFLIAMLAHALNDRMARRVEYLYEEFASSRRRSWQQLGQDGPLLIRSLTAALSRGILDRRLRATCSRLRRHRSSAGLRCSSSWVFQWLATRVSADCKAPLSNGVRAWLIALERGCASREDSFHGSHAATLAAL
jgi:hypothetical protein